MLKHCIYQSAAGPLEHVNISDGPLELTNIVLWRHCWCDVWLGFRRYMWWSYLFNCFITGHNSRYNSTHWKRALHRLRRFNKALSIHTDEDWHAHCHFNVNTCWLHSYNIERFFHYYDRAMRREKS